MVTPVVYNTAHVRETKLLQHDDYKLLIGRKIPHTYQFIRIRVFEIQKHFIHLNSYLIT